RLRDGFALGLAQASALAPGVSRHGATLAAGRARGFARTDADSLSWLTGLPAILAAVTLKTVRLSSCPRAPGQDAELLAGSSAAFCSTLAAARARPLRRAAGSSLLPYSLYRLALAALLLRCIRRTS
ncbi:MAG: undecaprenyl-diphosphate phosphatase, partial [Solirubrobacteraceae bacterium]